MGSSSGNCDHSPTKRHPCSSDSSSDTDRDSGDHNQNHKVNNSPLTTNITMNIHLNQPPCPTPPRTMAYAPAPPGHGHGQQNYYNPHPHPYAGYPNGYSIGHANHHAYYYPQPQVAAGRAYYGSAATVQQYKPAPSTNFFRGFIMCSFFLLMGLLLCSVIVNMILRPQAPVYKLESFSVSNFNAGNSSVTADWASKITIENPNERLNAYFSNLKVTVYHNQVELAHSSWLHGFELETHQNTQMDVNLSSNSQNSWLLVPVNAVEKITKERASGTITIGMGISTLTTFRYQSVLSRSRPIYAFCADIKLSFQGNSSSATALLNDTNKNCPLEMQLFE